MKQNIIMIIILITLFFFGLLIYDFSDELDKSVANYEWYTIEEGQMTVISFKNNKFSYLYDDTKKSFGDYVSCENYKYNSSINVIKLNCSIKGNKLYVTIEEDDELLVTIDGIIKRFYTTKEAAINANFMKENEISEEEFNSLMSYDLNSFASVTVDDLNDLYKVKKSELIAIIAKGDVIKDALNVNALVYLNNNIDSDVRIMILDELSSNELVKLKKLNDSTLEAGTIGIYQIGDKKMTLIDTININTYQQLKEYGN